MGVEIEVESDEWSVGLEDPAGLARVAAEAALAATGRAGGVVILLTDDAEIATLNADFRAKDGPTNVLSFPAPPNILGHLGDIALASGVCQREAAAQGRPSPTTCSIWWPMASCIFSAMIISRSRRR
jgi:probable rRNA maturation factor